MFYSHEVLTSQKHGVATIWLVATLGPRTTSKKVNRKAILGVDVPRACDTIINPEAPMALRLQGNLLYGVSRVYSRQCLYTLTDVQSMLDRMKTALKVVHGRGLNPNAGKARPEELIVPYDPAFIPEFTLPGLDVDLLKTPELMLCGPDLNSSVLSSHLSASSPSQLGSTLPQLNIPSPSFVAGEFGGFSFQSDSGNAFGDTELGEEGVLLRPDFDFDEEGNIIELSMDGGLEVQVETPARPQDEHSEVPEDVAGHPQDGDAMVLQDDDLIHDDELDPRDSPPPTSGRLPDPDYVEGNARSENSAYGRKKRGARKIQLDVSTQISQAELVQWEQEYLQNMSLAEKQKSYGRLIAQARKNATLWVSGCGIGSVGLGVGGSSVAHPLQSFCGEQLLAALSDGNGDSESEQGRKRRSSEIGQDEIDGSRRVRRRTSEEVEMGLEREYEAGEYDADMLVQRDVELGLGAPASLPDETSSQMPWNITASLQGSVAGSSSIPRPFDSFDRSSRRHFGRSNRLPGRFANLSPLAGRGLRQDLSGYDRLSSLSLDDFGDINDNDMGAYLGEDIPLEDADLFRDAEGLDAAETQETVSSLGHADRNFFDFLESRVQAVKNDGDQAQANARTMPLQKMGFSSIFPAESTSRSVATQALMHVLTLATKNVIRVSQRRATRGLPYSMEDLGDIYLVV